MVNSPQQEKLTIKLSRKLNTSDNLEINKQSNELTKVAENDNHANRRKSSRQIRTKVETYKESLDVDNYLKQMDVGSDIALTEPQTQNGSSQKKRKLFEPLRIRRKKKRKILVNNEKKEAAATHKKTKAIRAKRLSEPILSQQIMEKQERRKSINITVHESDILNENLDDWVPVGSEVCESCSDTGLVIFCESCIKPYHLHCCSPPLSSIPDDSWFCAGCKSRESSSTASPSQRSMSPLESNPFCSLIKNIRKERQITFKLPKRILKHFAYAGTDSDGNYVSKESKRIIHNSFCYSCKKDGTQLLECYECPLSYHIDCLDYPLAHPPRKWKCPNHSDAYLPKHRIRRNQVVQVVTSPFQKNSGRIIVDFKDRWYKVPEDFIQESFFHAVKSKRKFITMPEDVKELYSHGTLEKYCDRGIQTE